MRYSPVPFDLFPPLLLGDRAICATSLRSSEDVLTSFSACISHCENRVHGWVYDVSTGIVHDLVRGSITHRRRSSC